MVQRSLAHFGIGFHNQQPFAQSMYEVSPSTDVRLEIMPGGSVKSATPQPSTSSTFLTNSTATNRCERMENGSKELTLYSFRMDRSTYAAYIIGVCNLVNIVIALAKLHSTSRGSQGSIDKYILPEKTALLSE